MSVSENICQIEEFANSWKLQLEEEKKELQERHKKFSDLLTVFQNSLATGPSMKALENTKFLPPSNSVIHSILKDEEPGALVIYSDRDTKKKQLAEERKAEYNAFLEKKENELFLKRRNFEERSNVTPKSLLDFVDYEKVLARRKEEEERFRSLNQALYVQPKVQEAKTMGGNSIDTINSSGERNTNSSDDPLPVAQKYQMANNHQTVKLDLADHLPARHNISSSMKRSDQTVGEARSLGRVGGGGEPVRDSYGKLITTRGYKAEYSSWGGNSLSLPSMERVPNKDKNALYREELQRQIEEKKHLEFLERERAKQLEEKIAERTEMQRQQMLAEYEEESRRSKNLKEELQRQQERAKQLEEFQKKDAEMRKRKSTDIRPQGDNHYHESLQKRRSPSPPVPAVRTKELMERVITPVESLAQVKPENLFSSLAEIRRQILQSQEKMKKETKVSYEVMNRRTVADVEDESDEDAVSYSRVPSVAE